MSDLLAGFFIALSLHNLAYCFFGVLVGTALGVLPGIGSLAAVSMLLPITFYLDPTTALIMLAGVYYGTEYGGSTASILLNLPGTPANAVTCLDGYPLAQQGRAGVALFMTTIGSFIGGSIGILFLMFLSPLIVNFALAFGPAEYFAIILFGLIAAGAIVSGSPIKGMAMVVLGVLLGTIGSDINSGVFRFHMGMLELYDGISIVVLAMGLFGVAEVIASINRQTGEAFKTRISLRSMLPARGEFRRCILPMLRGTGIGSIAGPLPGTGPALAAYLAYAVEKQASKTPERFGTGAIEGVASPEAANNAAAQTAFIPTLTLGIPGTASMALMLGALMIHGITPGPRLMTEHADIFWAVVASFWIGNLLLLVLNIPAIGLWVSILKIPYRFLYPAVLCLICIGVYSVNNSSFDIFLVLAIGILGYGLRLLGFQPAPLLVGFVLGPLFEENLRRALLLSRGDFLALFERPISGSMVALAIAIVLFMTWNWWRKRRDTPRADAATADSEQ